MTKRNVRVIYVTFILKKKKSMANQIEFLGWSWIKTHTTINPKMKEEVGVFYIKWISNIKNVLNKGIQSKYIAMISKHFSNMKLFLKIKDGFVYSFLIQGVPGKWKEFEEILIEENNTLEIFLYLLYLSAVLIEDRDKLQNDLAEDILALEKEREALTT